VNDAAEWQLTSEPDALCRRRRFSTEHLNRQSRNSFRHRVH
jgi:hypothetical protein